MSEPHSQQERKQENHTGECQGSEPTSGITPSRSDADVNREFELVAQTPASAHYHEHKPAPVPLPPEEALATKPEQPEAIDYKQLTKAFMGKLAESSGEPLNSLLEQIGYSEPSSELPPPSDPGEQQTACAQHQNDDIRLQVRKHSQEFVTAFAKGSKASASELLEACNLQDPPSAPGEPPPPSEPEGEPQTEWAQHENDAGRAAQFCERFKDEILYIPERRSWLTWEGRWLPDSSGGLVRRAIQLANEKITQAADIPASSKAELQEKGELIRSALRWGNIATIKPLLEFAQSHPRTQASVLSLDSDPYLLASTNAVIDLRTGKARGHSPRDRITQFAGAKFVPDAKAPVWEKFLMDVFPDEEIREYIWRAVGYSATGSMGDEVFHICHSAGRSGKSKFIGAICHALGEYATTAGTDLVIATDRGADPLASKAAIIGKRFVRTPEFDEREKLNVKVIKDLTGGDELTGRVLYQNPITFKPCAKLWMASNFKPSVGDTGLAIWERVRLIPFDRYFAPEERDSRLEGKLQAEASGILNWIISGALRWQRDGLRPPPRIVAAVDEYRRDEDILGDFIDECIEVSTDGMVPHGNLFTSYKEWASRSGIRYPLSKRNLTKQLSARGWRHRETKQSRTTWEGVALV